MLLSVADAADTWEEGGGDLYMYMGKMNYTAAVEACAAEGARIPSFRTERQWIALQEMYKNKG